MDYPVSEKRFSGEPKAEGIIMPKKYEKTTKELSDILGKAGKERELREYLENLKSSREMVLSSYLNETLSAKGLVLSEVIRQSTVNPSYAYQFFNGKRKNPDKKRLIAICIACHMTLSETQRALEIAGCGILYPRDPYDAIIIYNINRENWSVMKINEQLHEHKKEPLVAEKETRDKPEKDAAGGTGGSTNPKAKK